MPARVFWTYVAGLFANLAAERLSLSRAVGLGMAGSDNPHAARVARDEQAAACLPR